MERIQVSQDGRLSSVDSKASRGHRVLTSQIHKNLRYKPEGSVVSVFLPPWGCTSHCDSQSPRILPLPLAGSVALCKGLRSASFSLSICEVALNV